MSSANNSASLTTAINPKEYLWVEKYRPSSVDQCILPERLIDAAKKMVSDGQVTNMIFFGSGGIGKTALACAIAQDIGCDWLLINCSKENGIDTIRVKLTQFASTASFTGKPKVVIMDESDNLTASSQFALRAFIEEFSQNCRFIFTCNYKQKLIEPLHSRLPNINFSMTPEEKTKHVYGMFSRVKNILDLEGVTYQPKAVADIITKFYPDFRRVIGELQIYASANGNKIDDKIMTSLEVDSSLLKDGMANKDFAKLRGWVAMNEHHGNELYGNIWSFVMKYAEPAVLFDSLLLVGEYQKAGSMVVDPSIQLSCCLIELMTNVQWDFSK